MAQFADNTLAITANTPDMGQDANPSQFNTPDRKSMAFNPVYLMDPLKILEGDEIYVELTDVSAA